MAKRAEMTKHRGIPSGLAGAGWQFTVRRANPKGASPIVERPRRFRGDQTEENADIAFLHALWNCFGTEPFERGNLDAGRVSRLFNREIIAAEKPFDATSYEAMLQINESAARKSFPQAFDDELDF